MKKTLLSLLAFAALGVTNADALTINDVTGLFTETYSYVGDGTYITTKTNVVDTVSICALDESQVLITGILGSDEDVTGILDAETNTIIVAPQTVLSYYTLSAATSVSDPVIITVADSTLSFSNAQLTCYNVQYASDVTSSMVKYAENTKYVLFSVPAQIYAIDSDNIVLYQGMTTLTKFNEGTYPYTVADYCGSGVTMKFYVDADGCIHTNGLAWYGWTYFYDPYWRNNNDDYLCFEDAASEIEDNGAQGGTAVLYGCYYDDYNNYLTTCHYMYYYINWGENIMGINNVVKDQKEGVSYNLFGQQADKQAKGLMIRDGKAIFVK